MRIGIIGAGRIGATAAKLLTRHGHQVAICNSRGQETLAQLVAELGPNASAGAPENVVEFAEVVLLALPWRNLDRLPRAELFAGKIVIDATNPYTDDGQIIDLEGKTSSDRVASLLPGARIVKAFNSLYWETLATGGQVNPDDRLVILVASDDVRAKSVVSQLIEDVGFAPVDIGSLREGGRRQQPGTELYNHTITIREARQLLVGIC